jgi:lysophospholipase L1-like esterase
MKNMPKQFIISLGICILSLLLIKCKKDTTLSGQNKSKDILIAKPLTDYGDSTFRGFRGGLYPDGNNQRPATHNAAGLAIAQTIKPLNAAGQLDGTNGKIVWLSIGMSNTTQETQAFLSLMQSFPDKNPNLVLIDGAVGGQDIKLINDNTAPYWSMVYDRLLAQNISSEQVQVIWFLEAEKVPTDTAFATYPDALKTDFKSVMQILKSKFKNLKIVYLSSRIYGGYATTQENPEPYAWYNGWTVKRLIEDQINGDNSLKYNGANASSAWLSWASYNWANGTTPRNDGLVWLRSDFVNDGTHPSVSGRQKVAQMLLNFFTTDETAKPWFLKN